MSLLVDEGAKEELAKYKERARYWQSEYEKLRNDLPYLYAMGDYAKLDAKCQDQAKQIEELFKARESYRNHMVKILSKKADLISRLEAAFIESNAARRYYRAGNRGPWPQVGEKFKEPWITKAREALAKLKESVSK